jgi:DNA-directed RNA polymerase specialized sigma24 family protein
VSALDHLDRAQLARIAHWCGASPRAAWIDELRRLGPFSRGGVVRAQAVSVVCPRLDVADPRPGPAEVAALRDEVCAFLARVGCPRRGLALWLRDGLGLPLRDVGATLGVQASRASVLASEARERIRARGP